MRKAAHKAPGFNLWKPGAGGPRKDYPKAFACIVLSAVISMGAIMLALKILL